MTHYTLRTTKPDLRSGNVFRADLEILRDIVKLNRHIDSNFCHRIARNREPQAYSQSHRHQLESQIMEHVAMQKVAHSLSDPSLVSSAHHLSASRLAGAKKFAIPRLRNYLMPRYR